MVDVLADQAEVDPLVDRQMQLGAAHAIGVNELPAPLPRNHINGAHRGAGIHRRHRRRIGPQGVLLFRSEGIKLVVDLHGVQRDRKHDHRWNHRPGDLKAVAALDACGGNQL